MRVRPAAECEARKYRGGGLGRAQQEVQGVAGGAQREQEPKRGDSTDASTLKVGATEEGF